MGRLRSATGSVHFHGYPLPMPIPHARAWLTLAFASLALAGGTLNYTGAADLVTAANVGLNVSASGNLTTTSGNIVFTGASLFFAFIALILVLTLRPSGLLGERVADRA